MNRSENKRPLAQVPNFYLICLCGILILAAIVRFTGIAFGLPYTGSRPDEDLVLNYSLRIAHGSPQFFDYPSLFLMLCFAADAMYFLGGRLIGHFGSMRDFVNGFAVQPDHFIIINRALSATLGTASVLLVHAIGKRMMGRVGALCAAFFLSVAYLHVRDSHFGTVDVAMTFMVLATLLLQLKAHDDHKRSSYIVAALMTGLSISTKYSALPLLGTLSLCYLFSYIDSRRPLLPWATTGGWWPIAVAVPLGFLLGTPFLLWDFHRFAADFAFTMLQGGHVPPWLGDQAGRGWTYHLRFSLWFGVGWPMFISSAIGAVIAIRRWPRIALIVLSFPVGYWLTVGFSRAVFVRYAVPMVPFICIFAAAVPMEIYRQLDNSNRSPGVARLGALLACLGIASVGIYRTIMVDRLLITPDNRLLASNWLESHVPQGWSIGFTGSAFGWPEIWDTPAQIEAGLAKAKPNAAPGEKPASTSGFDLARLKHVELPSTKSYLVSHFDDDKKSFSNRVTEEPADAPMVLVLQSYPLRYARHDPSLDGMLGNYIEVEHLASLDNSAAGNRFDILDAFYIPYAGFNSVDRPGPNFDIYVRRDVVLPVNMN